MTPAHTITITAKEGASAATMLQNAAALPSLSRDPAWAARQERILAAVVVGCALMFWLGGKGYYLLAVGLGMGVMVYVLRELRTLEHMARVTPPTEPVNDPSLIAPALGDWQGAADRPLFVVSQGGGLLGPDGALWQTDQIASQYAEISLGGDETNGLYWVAVERLNAAGVHVLGAGLGGAL